MGVRDVCHSTVTLFPAVMGSCALSGTPGILFIYGPTIGHNNQSDAITKSPRCIYTVSVTVDSHATRILLEDISGAQQQIVLVHAKRYTFSCPLEPSLVTLTQATIHLRCCPTSLCHQALSQPIVQVCDFGVIRRSVPTSYTPMFMAINERTGKRPEFVDNAQKG